MTRIAALTLDQASPAAQAILQDTKAKLGMVPNLFSTLAHAPDALAGYLQLNGALQNGSLSPAERESIALAVGQVNRCAYCLSAHTLMGKGAGLSADAIATARQIALSRGQISDADLAAARAAGLDDAKIIEVTALVALNVLTNYVNNVAGTVIDFPVVTV